MHGSDTRKHVSGGREPAQDAVTVAWKCAEYAMGMLGAGPGATGAVEMPTVSDGMLAVCLDAA